MHFPGHGTSTNPNGANYVGEWKDDKINGHGTYTYPDGTNYVGEYKDHKRNGQGTYTWLDGSKYVGEWKDNLHSGLGEKYYSDLGHVYEGNWVEGRREGHGKLFFENGSVFTGVWEYVANSLRPSAGSGNLQLTTGDIIPGFVSSDNVFIERGVLVDDDRKFEINEIVWLELDGDRVEAKILNSRGEKFRVEYLNKKGKTKSATVSAGELTKMD